MKKFNCRISATLIALVMLVSTCSPTMAAFLTDNPAGRSVTRASYYLAGYEVWVSRKGGGDIGVNFSVQASQKVAELGAKTITLEVSKDNGDTWEVAKEYSGEDWMSTTDGLIFSGTKTYNGVTGYQYRAYGTVFASDGPNKGDSKTTRTSRAITA